MFSGLQTTMKKTSSGADKQAPCAEKEESCEHTIEHGKGQATCAALSVTVPLEQSKQGG